MEDVIKLRWNDMSLEQKVFVKENVMRMVETVGEGNLGNLHLIKDGISRPVVEIIKREWPQHWPTLLAELNQICTKGEIQTETVMLVILRLVEDVAVFQTLEQQQRRKEIYQALTSNMEEIFQFLLQLLERHYQGYLGMKQSGDIAKADRHCKVCQAVLNTFSAFIEWVAMSHIMANDKYLIRCLCHLLSDDKLQLNAADCLLNIVGWKSGKAQDRMQLLSLFSTDMMAPLFQATERANQRALDEDHYNFLKKMVQILVELGGQLCALWAKDGPLWKKEMAESKRPQNFDIYLNALLAFTSHPSQTVNHYVNELWAKFFRHADISSDEVFSTYIPKWVNLVVKKCVRTGLPSREDSPSCAYSMLDFDSDEEFNAFFGRYKIIILEGIKLISAESPVIPFQNVELWLKQILSNPLDLGKPGNKCTTMSPTYLQLEAIAAVLEAILGKLSKEQLTPIMPASLNLAKMCLDYPSTDPVFSSVLLSCVSSLFVVIGTSPAELLMPTLNKIFSFITYMDSPGPINGNQFSEDSKMLRRHACALMVKLGTRQPEVLLPMFTHLRDTVVNLQAQGSIFQMEFVTLVEALVLISNELKNYQMQSDFLKAVSQPVIEQFQTLEPAIRTSISLMNFIGLTKPMAQSDQEPMKSNRGELFFTTNFLLAICRRATCPDSLQACQTGGFVLSQNAEHVALRNPAWPVAQAVLPHIFMLAKTMNHLWAPDNIAELHPEYAQALSMLESERNTISGVGNRQQNQAAKTKTALTRMQSFLFDIFENNYHFLSQVCTSFGYEFYQMPNVAQGIVGSVLDGSNFLPDFRLRAIVRMFLKSLINKCPKSSYAGVLAPIIQALLPYMMNRLSERWKQLAILRESPNYDENNTDSQEVIDDVVCRHLAREYLDVVKAILTSGGGSDISLGTFAMTKSNSAELAFNNSESNTETTNSVNSKINTNAIALSELGRLVLQHDSLGHCVIETLLRALVWPDSPSSVRACTLLELVLPMLIQNGRMSDQDASQIMISIIRAIHELGQHEANYIALIALAIQAYEWLRPRYESIIGVLAQVPGCNPEDLKRFDDRMMAAISGKENMKGGDRAKKDMFKKLISQFIGKDLAKMFKHEVVIKNLPTPVVPKPRHKTPSLDDTEKSDIGICSLFSQNGTQK
jgi:exportin-5